ncbi:hypothetical protein C2857_007423 [Epichloe festucae Fl1]|uniref:Uncharacterized protein n=1 Tax=Epichloe festucae (strain Fl1) TaxID=877507 RepID=A0A7S9PV03_EPIFF|nr:hypothetical protein C2857_007423 [Epichloe festucae Fl1]
MTTISVRQCSYMHYLRTSCANFEKHSPATPELPRITAKNGVTPVKRLCPLWRASSKKDDFPAPVQEVKNSEASKASEAKGKAKAIATGLGLSR